jgi:cytochrome P450
MAIFWRCIGFGEYYEERPTKARICSIIRWLTSISLIQQAALYQSTRIVYNLFLHPLRKFPGPVAQRASRLPWAYMHARGQQAFRTQKSHEEYGPVVRVGPNHLSFTDPRAWKDIYAYRAAGEMAKADAFFRPMKGLPSSILNADIEEHSRIRRALAQGFSDASMRAQEPLIKGYVKLLVERLTHESEGGQSVQNMAAWCTYQSRGAAC